MPVRQISLFPILRNDDYFYPGYSVPGQRSRAWLAGIHQPRDLLGDQVENNGRPAGVSRPLSGNEDRAGQGCRYKSTREIGY